MVFGDYIGEDPNWPKFMAPSERWRDALVAAGGTVDWLDLPEAGITGNTHMLMMDLNSDEIAGRILTWIEDQALSR